jgi:ASC-1-like (ASCH) protein
MSEARAKTAKTIYCSDPWFSLIQSGVKTVEGRKNSPSWNRLKAGDSLLFVEPEAIQSSPRLFLMRIVSVAVYAPGPGALRRYLEGETLARALPGVQTLEAAELVFYSPPINWTPTEVEEYGMLALRLEPHPMPL